MNQNFRRNLFGSFLSFVLVIVVWQMIVSLGHVAPYVAPQPLDAWRSLTTHWSTLWPLVLGTIGETVVGFVVGATLGLGLGVVLAKRRFIQRVVYPILILTQAIPIIALAPPLVLVFGFNLAPKVIIVAWIVFFPVTVNVLDGLSHVDRDLLTLARSYGATPWRTFIAIELPASATII